MTPIIVVPAHDEAAAIGGVVRGARRHARVLVIDDGSTDGTADRAREAGAEVIVHARRLGKAQAIRTGVAAARARRATVVVTMDGDGQHDPGQIPVLLAAAAAAPDAIVVGRRAAGAGLTAGRHNAVRVASFFVSWVSGQDVGDSQSGFRAYPMAIFAEVATRRGGFVFETEVLLAAARQGWRVVEVPVEARARVSSASRFRPCIDGAAITLFLAGRVAACWAREMRAAVDAVTDVVRLERMRVRHGAMLADAAPFRETPSLWGWVLGAAATRRAAARLRSWTTHPRSRRALGVAAATVAAPPVLALVLVQTLLAGLVPDPLTPLVRACYAPRRLRAREAPRSSPRASETFAAEPVTPP